MNQTESLSDSDSNTSTSWIFLDECSHSSVTDKNKYYLNCSSEPIQELTPQCLSPVNLEPETDSDGISIISESEDLSEQISEEIPLIEDVKHVTTIQEEPTKIKVEYYMNKYVVIGWIIIAMMTPFVLNYFSAYVRKVSESFQDDTAVGFTKSDSLSEEKIHKLDDGIFHEPSVEKIPNHLTHQTSCDNQNVLENDKKTLNSKKNINIDWLDHQKPEDGQLIISEDRKKGKNKNGKHKKGEFARDEKYEFRNKFSGREVTSKLTKNFVTGQVSMESKNVQRQNKKLKTEVKKNLAGKGNLEKPEHTNVTVMKDKNGKKKEHHKKKDESLKNKNVKNEYVQNKKKKQEKVEKTVDNSKNNSYQKEVKKLKKTLERKEKEIKELVKTVKIKDRHLKMLEFKILKELNALKKLGTAESKIAKEIDNQNFFEEKTNTTSGEWYDKLHKGRSRIRNNHCASDWVFDRANFRNKKRNSKNNWYWNWMSDREQLRRGFWQFTY